MNWFRDNIELVIMALAAAFLFYLFYLLGGIEHRNEDKANNCHANNGELVKDYRGNPVCISTQVIIKESNHERL